MRRFALAVAGTSIGTAVLIGLKLSGTDERPPPSAFVTPGPSGVPSALPSRPAVGAPPTTRAPGPSSAPAPPKHPAVRTIDGPVVRTRYGDVQVEIVLSGTKVTDVKATRLPGEDRRSRDISRRAEPILREEALQAQSADIDLVSGATYTSEAYIDSLQAALDAM